MSHYTAAAGLEGQAPDQEQAYGTRSAAADSLAEQFDLTENQTKRLRREGWLRLSADEHGVEYAEIKECDCDSPWDHSDTETAADWSEDVS